MKPESTSLSTNFADVYGSPGEAPRVMGLLRAFWPLLVICLLTGYLLRALLPVPALTASSVGVLFFLLAAAAGVLLVWGSRRLQNYLKGAKGEEWVAHELGFLSSDYSVFNGLNLKGGQQNFDHIIVGPSGIFVVETKNWRGSVEFREGRLFCEGREPSRPPIKQVKAATAELVEFIETAGISGAPVHSVLCFISTELPEPVMNVNGVIICNGDRLCNVLTESFQEPVSSGITDSIIHELKKNFI